MEITVSSIMLAKIITCDSTCNLKKIAQKIIDEDAGSVLIKKEEELTGLITEKDLLRAVLKNKDFETTQAIHHLRCIQSYCAALRTVLKNAWRFLKKQSVLA